MERQKNWLQNTWMICIGALICCALWGSAFPCIKLGYKWFAIGPKDSATQIIFAGLRFVLAGLMVIAIKCICERKIFFPKTKGNVVKLAFVQTVAQYVLFYIGLAHTTGVKASIIEGSNVFIALFVASFLFHQEHLDRRKVIGSAIGFAGVVLINLQGGSMKMEMSLLGDGCVFLSTVAYGVSSVLIKRYAQKEDPVVLSGYQFLTGGLIMIAAGAGMGGRLHAVCANGIGMLIYLAFVSAVAYTLWGILLKYNDVSKVAIYGFTNPIFGVLLSALFLGETEQAFGKNSLIALVMVSAGICLAQLATKKDSKDRHLSGANEK